MTNFAGVAPGNSRGHRHSREGRPISAAVHVFEDPAGNQLIVEALTGGTAVIRFVQQDGEQPKVIITPDEAQAIADAVREATR